MISLMSSGPGRAGGLSTSFQDVADFVMSADDLDITAGFNVITVGDVRTFGTALIESALDRGLLTPCGWRILTLHENSGN